MALPQCPALLLLAAALTAPFVAAVELRWRRARL